MKLFECQNCGQLVYFENTQCERCGHALGFLAERAVVTALAPKDGAAFTTLVDPTLQVHYCANHGHDVCNWLLQGDGELCTACKLNHTIPDLSQADSLQRWQKIERAKHRLVYSLLRLSLPVESKVEAPQSGLQFEFLAPAENKDGQGHVLTGHDNGIITLNVIEADDVKRAEMREKMGEPYRTLLGHFRHESAHYYFERIVKDTPRYPFFLQTFGDETADYDQALKTYYANGAPADWRDHHISAYASAHPHEDWAETFAHYLHMVDTLETGYAFGLRIRPRVGDDDNLRAALSFDPYSQNSFQPIIEAWLPMTFAVNSVNRSMGIDDLYPFVISPAVIMKLAAVHEIIHGYSSNAAAAKLA